MANRELDWPGLSFWLRLRTWVSRSGRTRQSFSTAQAASPQKIFERWILPQLTRMGTVRFSDDTASIGSCLVDCRRVYVRTAERLGNASNTEVTTRPSCGSAQTVASAGFAAEAATSRSLAVSSNSRPFGSRSAYDANCVIFKRNGSAEPCPGSDASAETKRSLLPATVAISARRLSCEPVFAASTSTIGRGSFSTTGFPSLDRRPSMGIMPRPATLHRRTGESPAMSNSMDTTPLPHSRRPS